MEDMDPRPEYEQQPEQPYQEGIVQDDMQNAPYDVVFEEYEDEPALEQKERLRRRIFFFKPLQNRLKRNIILFGAIPALMLLLFIGFKIWVDNQSSLPPWLATAVGRRDMMESDFDDISYTPPKEIEAAEDYVEQLPDASVTAITGNGYIDTVATNDRYDGYTCDPTKPTDIIVMDIQPQEIPERKQTIMYVKLFNTGAATANVIITFTADDGTRYEGRIEAIPSCSSQSRFRWTPKKDGEIKVTSIVNSDKNVDEESFDNNAKTVVVYVGRKAPVVPMPSSNPYVEWTEPASEKKKTGN